MCLGLRRTTPIVRPAERRSAAPSSPRPPSQHRSSARQIRGVRRELAAAEVRRQLAARIARQLGPGSASGSAPTARWIRVSRSAGLLAVFAIWIGWSAGSYGGGNGRGSYPQLRATARAAVMDRARLTAARSAAPSYSAPRSSGGVAAAMPVEAVVAAMPPVAAVATAAADIANPNDVKQAPSGAGAVSNGRPFCCVQRHCSELGFAWRRDMSRRPVNSACYEGDYLPERIGCAKSTPSVR